MKVFLVLLVIFGGYMFLLLQTANIAINQTRQLSRIYQSASDNSQQIATGRTR